MSEKESSRKRKASDAELYSMKAGSVEDLLMILINKIDDLSEENLMLHKQMDIVCQDVESLRCLLEEKSSKTNYTSKKDNVEEEKKSKVGESTNIMVEDDEDKLEVKSNNNINNNVNTTNGNTAGVVEKKKIERKNRRKPCEHCNMWSHQEDKCFRKNPSIAPDEWRKKAEELKKKEGERKIYEDKMDFNAKLAYATASREEKREERYKPLGPASREWEEAKKEFEKVERFRREEKTKERERSPTCKNCKRSGHEKDVCWLLHPEIAPYWWEWRRAESSMEKKKRLEKENPWKGRKR